MMSVIIVYQHYQKVKRDKELQYIIEKLQEIIQNDSIERIKLFTENKEVRAVVQNINQLLDHNHYNKMQYNKTKQSMKMMLSNISHDLKTPLTVILGYTEMLQITGKEKNMVDKVYVKTRELLMLIDKFFDLAKLESGDTYIDMSRINIGDICRLVISDFYDVLSAENIEVQIDIPEKSIYVMGNEEAIRRILNNLISNAVKYGMDGKFLGITVKEEDYLVRIEVTDRGKGISEKYREAVFERIFTLEDSRSKAYQGSGIGLTITKQLVETLGGEIYLQSIPGECTVFSFVLHKVAY